MAYQEVMPKDLVPNPVAVTHYKAMDEAEILSSWDTPLNDKTTIAVRDARAIAMKARDLRPDHWIHDREHFAGIYPSTEDAEFASLVQRKTEFAALASPAEPDECGSGSGIFDTTPIQKLVARFLHPTTPYRSVMLNHGVGVGKTCSAITIAETFLELRNKQVFIIAPQAIAEGFRRTIFDVSRLTEASKEHQLLTGERWISSQCTGMTYLRLTGMANHPDKEEIAKEVGKLVKQRYQIMGSVKFYNWVYTQVLAVTFAGQTEAQQDEAKKTLFRSLFADRLLIVDEAHNLRDEGGGDEAFAEEVSVAKTSDAAIGKKLTPVLVDIIRYAEGMRLVLMTATPMYDTAPEIILLLNLLLLNDTKDVDQMLDVDTFFTKQGDLRPAAESKLVAVIRRYVSFMRGENPTTFPLRLMPVEQAGHTFADAYPTMGISHAADALLSPKDKDIFAALPIVVHPVAAESLMGKALTEMLADRYKEERTAEAFVPDRAIQMGNMIYPDETYGTVGFQSHFKESTGTFGSLKVTQLTWNVKASRSLEEVFRTDLVTHGPKLAAIVDHVVKGQGLSFLYSRYINAGIIPLAIALELAGGCRVLADGTLAPLIKREGAAAPTFTYILLTSSDSYSPNFKGLLDYATTFKNMEEARDGTKVKAILGSQIAGEGLDLKCIRQLHLLDGWYHLNRVEQIEGRGVRYCSHQLLPKALRNCVLYLHTVTIPTYETPDLYAYRIAIGKAQQIGKITRLLKRYAWDCRLNEHANQIAPYTADVTDAFGVQRFKRLDADGNPVAEKIQDQPYSAICDYEAECEYDCASEALGAARDSSTLRLTDMRQILLNCADRVLHRFKTEDVAIPYKTLLKTIYKDVPTDFAIIGLREILGIRKLRRTNGSLGTLILKNGYVVFQPDRVTDTAIPIAIRYTRLASRLPRTFVLQRPLLQPSAPPLAAAASSAAPSSAAASSSSASSSAAASSSAVAEPIAAGNSSTAYASLERWLNVLQTQVLSKDAKHIEPPAPFTADSYALFTGWRWVFHHFGTNSALQAEVIAIAANWWMDNVWSVKERGAVLLDLATTPASNPIQRLVFKELHGKELYSEQVQGYLQYDTSSNTVIPYCVTEGEPQVCASNLTEFIEAEIGSPLDLEADTLNIYGFLTLKNGTIIFKTLNKSTGDTRGAECATSANLNPHILRVQVIQAQIRSVAPDSAIIPLLLDDSNATKPETEEKKARQDAVKERYDPPKKSKLANPALDVNHVAGLSLKQICPYTEFLLRWLDRNMPSNNSASAAASGRRRSFLSLVDVVRATSAVEKKPRASGQAVKAKAIASAKK